MKEYGIIFNGESIPLIRAGRMTMTRRVCKELIGQPSCNLRFEPSSGVWQYYGAGGVWLDLRCPYGVSGDRLWVKETWAQIWNQEYCRKECDVFGTWGDVQNEEAVFGGACPCGGCHIEYKADTGAKYPGGWDDDAKGDPDCPKWRSPRFMPRWASRTFAAENPLVLERVDDRSPERLQEISQADIIAEGVTWTDRYLDFHEWVSAVASGVGSSRTTDREFFEQMWNSLNAKRGHGWDENDWVWPIGFKRVENA